MSDEIECALSGRLTADPVERTSAKGKAWMSMNLAVGSGDAVQFVSVALFGETVHEMATRLHKGDHAYVEGRIALRQWTDKEGRERTSLNVSSFHIVPLGQIGKRRPGKLPARAKSADDAYRDWQRPPSADTEITF